MFRNIEILKQYHRVVGHATPQFNDRLRRLRRATTWRQLPMRRKSTKSWSWERPHRTDCLRISSPAMKTVMRCVWAFKHVKVVFTKMTTHDTTKIHLRGGVVEKCQTVFLLRRFVFSLSQYLYSTTPMLGYRWHSVALALRWRLVCAG